MCVYVCACLISVGVLHAICCTVVQTTSTRRIIAGGGVKYHGNVGVTLRHGKRFRTPRAEFTLLRISKFTAETYLV